MPKTQESMRQLHNLYAIEIDECVENLIKSKEASSAVVEARQENEDMQNMILFDQYMSTISRNMELVRKLRFHIQYNELYKILKNLLINGSINERPEVPETASVNADNNKLMNGVSGAKHKQQQETPAAPNFDKKATTIHSVSSPVATKATLPPAEEIINISDSTSDTSYISEARFIYQKPDLSVYQPGDIIEATLSYVGNAERLRFYIVVGDKVIGKEIHELAKKKHLPQYHAPPGNEVFGLSLDGKIYRAVRDFSDEGTKPVATAESMLIDVGELIEINKDSIMYRLEHNLQQLPGLAISCELHVVQGKRTCRQLKKLLKSLEYEMIKCQIKEVRGDMLKIEIIDKPRAAPNKAPEVVPESVAKPGPLNKNNPFYGELSAEDLEMLNEEPLATTNAMKAVLGYDPKDDRRICRFYDPKINGCFKGANCQLEHTAKQPEGWTKDVEPDANVAQDFATTYGFKRGTVINVTVTHITDVDRFYANINDPIKHMEPLLWVPEFISQDQRLQRLPKIFEIVMAKYQDGHWYRARVEETNEIGKLVRVFYVDYGNEQVIHLNNLAHCDVGIAQLPFRAVLCRLAHVCKATTSIEQCKSGIHYLNSTILNGTMGVKVVFNHEDLWVSFCDDFHKGVVEELKTMGVLEDCETIIS